VQKKKKSQSRHSKRRERKKKLKKKRPITSACDGWTRVGQKLIPAI